jgi:hypothetical protein
MDGTGRYFVIVLLSSLFLLFVVIVGTPYGQPADVFSFGVTLTEMILRKKPEERHPRNAFDFEIEDFKAALPADCPAEFSALVIECCKYDPPKV